MTITETSHPHRPGAERPPCVDEPVSPFARRAGTFAVAAGVLMTVAQLLWLPYDAKDHQATAQNTVFQTGSVLYLIGFCALLLTAASAYGWQAKRAGRLGVVAVSATLVGTFLLGGDLWFEAFAVPFVADSSAPQVLEDDPTILIGVGALSSYLLFAIGWLLFGISSYRARVFPKAIAIAVAVTGVLGFQALVAPFGIPLAVAVGSLGVWMIRHTPAEA